MKKLFTLLLITFSLAGFGQLDTTFITSGFEDIESPQGYYVRTSETGTWLELREYHQGIETGTRLEYNYLHTTPQGPVAKKYTYKNGKPHGPYFQYRDDGSVLCEGQYNEGVETGSFKWYDRDGAIVKEFSYR